jgi:hypothetical protein
MSIIYIRCEIVFTCNYESFKSFVDFVIYPGDSISFTLLLLITVIWSAKIFRLLFTFQYPSTLVSISFLQLIDRGL